MVQSVRVWDTQTGTIKTLTNADCHFGYRTSIFNTDQKGRYLILQVIIKLNKEGRPNLSYQGLRAFFSEPPTTPEQMRDAVIHIRERKLPDPDEIGSAGSFFKNILLDEEGFARLITHVREHLGEDTVAKLHSFRDRFPGDEGIKIPTAYLIEACGLARGMQSKGAKLGGAALSPQHALILTNASGRATADEVMRLARKVRQAVYAKTGLVIQPEPTLVGFPKEKLEAYLALE
ncbi:MAG: UDP-N-acetylenolpyruvoylglucosamine reductase [Chloroflexi bacterium]|nr:UDP-N-acetylenolpyruvoylglucosamine reductase [Chloroflexota bacterium]